MPQHLSKTELLCELARRPGLIPIELAAGKQRLLWADVAQFHFYEGFFHRSLKLLAALKQGELVTFTSELEALHDEAVVADALPPTGLIFHAGRCGSTLLAKVLARSRAHLVVAEAAPHNQIWECLTAGWQQPVTANEANRRLYRHLILALGRKRLRTHAAHFIKFTSFNILFFEFIRRVFPEVPALFLFREPRAVLVSMQRNPPGWLLTESAAQQFIVGQRLAERAAAAELALQRYLSAALQTGAQGLRYLAYAQLTAANLPALLRFFQLAPAPEQLRLMQAQFAYNAKQDYRQHRFQPDQTEKQAAWCTGSVSPELQALYERLARSELNMLK